MEKKAILLGFLICLLTFFKFFISGGTLIYLDHIPSLYPEKSLKERFSEFNTWGFASLMSIPFLIFYLIPLSKIIGVFNSLEILWIISFSLGSLFLYKTFKHLRIPYWYVGCLILLLNPYIYLRITAGQMGIVLSTVLSPIFLYYLFTFPNNKNFLALSLSFTVSSMFQPHFFIMNSIILLIYLTILLIRKRVEVRDVLKLSLFLLAINSYWIVFAFFFKPKLLEAVNREHFLFFSPKPSINVNTLEKIVGMYGFWREVAVKKLYSENAILFHAYVFLTLYLFTLGIYRSVDDETLLFLILFILGVLLSLVTPYISFISLFKSFRDSHKFAYFILLSYAFLIPKGLREFGKKFSYLFVLLWLFFNKYQILLYNQINPINYPKEYLLMDKYLENVDGRIVYIPWGIYFTYNWSLEAGLDGRLANIANSVFKKHIIVGCNPSLDFCVETNIQKKIRKCLDTKNYTCLENIGIKYILYDKSVIYPKINMTELKLVKKIGFLELYSFK